MGYLDYPLCIYKQLLDYSLLHNYISRQIYYSLYVSVKYNNIININNIIIAY